MATQAALKSSAETEKPQETATKESQSFTMNLFRGQLQLNQVFPFPEPMNEEQTDTLKMLIDPVEKFYEVHTSFFFKKKRTRVHIYLLITHLFLFFFYRK